MKSSRRGRGTPQGISVKHAASRSDVSVVKEPAPPPAQPQSSPLWLPALSTLVFAAFTLLPRVNSDPKLIRSFVGAGACLAIGLIALWLHARRSGRALTYEFVPRRVH